MGAPASLAMFCACRCWLTETLWPRCAMLCVAAQVHGAGPGICARHLGGRPPCHQSGCLMVPPRVSLPFEGGRGACATCCVAWWERDGGLTGQCAAGSAHVACLRSTVVCMLPRASPWPSLTVPVPRALCGSVEAQSRGDVSTYRHRRNQPSCTPVPTASQPECILSTHVHMCYRPCPLPASPCVPGLARRGLVAAQASPVELRPGAVLKFAASTRTYVYRVRPAGAGAGVGAPAAGGPAVAASQAAGGGPAPVHKRPSQESQGQEAPAAGVAAAGAPKRTRVTFGEEQVGKRGAVRPCHMGAACHDMGEPSRCAMAGAGAPALAAAASCRSTADAMSAWSLWAVPHLMVHCRGVVVNCVLCAGALWCTVWCAMWCHGAGDWLLGWAGRLCGSCRAPAGRARWSGPLCQCRQHHCAAGGGRRRQQQRQWQQGQAAAGEVSICIFGPHAAGLCGAIEGSFVICIHTHMVLHQAGRLVVALIAGTKKGGTVLRWAATQVQAAC